MAELGSYQSRIQDFVKHIREIGGVDEGGVWWNVVLATSDQKHTVMEFNTATISFKIDFSC